MKNEIIPERARRMFEEYKRNPGVVVFSGRWAGKTVLHKLMMRWAAAQNGGKIIVTRKDRDTGKWISEEITADMPLDEIIL